MPKQIDLEPHEWQSRRKPRLKHPLDNPKVARNMLIIPIVFLALGFWTGDIPDWTDYWGAAFFGWLAGGLMVYWLKDVR